MGAEAAEHRNRRAVELLGAHSGSLRRVASRYSLCPDDAEDAVQRAAEILLTKAPALEHDRLIAWMVVVTKHEALAVRRSRDRLLAGSAWAGGDVADPLDSLPSELPGPRERAERSERLREARRALASLKANERLAILLQAEGFSYAEICELCGWTYTKATPQLSPELFGPIPVSGESAVAGTRPSTGDSE